MSDKYVVYVHTNKENGLRYVGITKNENPELRWQHGEGYHKQRCFYNAIQKYGWDGFEHEVLASGLTSSEAFTLEQHYIALWDTTARTKGYNRSTGGEAGAKGVEHTATQRKASSETMQRLWADKDFVAKHRQRMIAFNKSPEARRSRSETNRGRVCSEETRQLMSQNRKGKGTQPKSAATKARIKEHHAGGADGRPVICLETGELFESINAAAKAKGINKKGISGCCRGVAHYNTAGGLRWAFAGKEN